MATSTTLGFSILTRYSGHGVSEARRDLAALRAQMAATDGQVQTSNRNLGTIPKRWQAIASAVAAVAPAMVPLGAQALQVAASFTAMSAAVGVSLGAYALAVKNAIKTTNDMAKAHKALSAEQKNFLQQQGAVKSAIANFGASFRDLTLKGVSDFFEGAARGLTKLQSVAKAITPEINRVAAAFNNWTKGASFDNYIKIIGAAAPTAFRNLSDAARSFLNVVGDGFRAFLPLGVRMTQTIKEGAESLNKWSDGGGFQRFLAYVKENGPAVSAFWKAFGDALSSVFGVLKGFGGSTLTIMTDALRAIATLNFDNVKAAAQSFLLLRSPIAFLVLNCPPLRDAFIALLGALNPATIYAVAAAFGVLKISIMLMNASLISTPVGWLIIALAALAVGIVFIATKTTWFQTAWTYTWNAIQTVASTVWNFLTQGLGQLTLLLMGPLGVLAILALNWGTIWNGMLIAAQAVWMALQVAWNAVVFGLSTAWSAVSGALVAAWNATWSGMSTAVQAVWSALTLAWNAVVFGFSTAWTTVSGALVAAWNAVWSGMATAVQAVWSGLTAAWNAFTMALSAAWTATSGALTAAWNATWNALKAAAQAVWTAMQAAWSAFTSALNTAWSAASGALTASWNAVWNAIKAAGQAIWTAMQAAWQAFLTAVNTIWTTTSAALTASWNLVWNALKLAATTIWTAMQLAWQLFLTAVQTIWTTTAAALTAAWNAAWNAIKTAATTIWDALKAAWTTFTTAIRTVWDTAGAALKKAWSDVWNALKATAKKIWDEITSTIKSAINAIIGLINKIGGGINNIASKVGLGDIIPSIPTLNAGGVVEFAVGGITGDMPHFSAGGSVNFARGGGTLSGFAPGRDTVPAILSRGEGVLTPEAVRGLGGAGFVHSANRKFAGHRGAGKGAAPLSQFGFADGGIALGGGVQAFHRTGPDPGWGFAIGGLPSEIPVPGGGTVGQEPGKDVNKPKGSVLDLLPDDLPDPSDLAKQILGIGGTSAMMLGFLGKEAIQKLFDPIFSMVSGYGGPGGDFAKIFVAAVKKLVTAAMEWLIKKDEDAKKDYEAHSVAGAQSVQAWAPLAAKAIAMGGLAPIQLTKFLALMAAESGGNPNAINTTDINAQNGIPSQGLMQVIPPTFAAYHVAGTSNNILDPLANMAASAAYIRARYGGNVPGSPYALGTPGATSGVHLVGEQGPELVNFAGGETVTPAGETASILSGPGTPAGAAAVPATAAPAAAGGMGAGSTGASGGGSITTPDDVQALIASLLESSSALQEQIDAMWKQVVASTSAGWSSVNGDSLTPMNAALATTVPGSLTALQGQWTAGWTAVGATATTQWTAMEGTAFTPLNAMMTTTVPAAATTMQTGVTDATGQMQTDVQGSWDGMLSGTQTTWTGISSSITESVDTATVPINGLLGGFNNVSSALGMGISVPLIAYEAGGVAGFSTGGMLAQNGGAVPGYSPGRDTFPAMLSPGEGVLTPEAVRGLGGPGFVFAANRKYSGHRGGGGSTSESLGKYMGHEAKCGHATGGMAGVMHNGVQHFASGTITAQDAAGLAEAGVSTGSVSQGSFNSSVAASGSTHSGDGVVDISDLGAVDALRNAGWAAWLRTPEEGFAYHVHAVYMKATGVDPSAMGQEISYINGGSGLPAGSASSAETGQWGLNLGEWNFGPLIKTIIDGGITSIPPLLAPLVKKHLTKEQVASGFSTLKAALDGTNMGAGPFGDSEMALGVKTHDGIVDSVAAGATSFDSGGLLQPGYTLAFNGTGKPEPVGHNLEPKGNSDRPIVFEVHAHGSATADDVVEGINTQVLPKLRQYLNKGTGSNA